MKHILIALFLCSCVIAHDNTKSSVLTPYFTPNMYPDLVYWLAPDTLTSYSNGDAIMSWTDLSDSKKDMIQLFSNLAPSAMTNRLNGYTTVLFNGTKSMSVSTFAPAVGNSPRTFIVLIQNAVSTLSSFEHVIYSYGTGGSGAGAVGLDYGLSYNHASSGIIYALTNQNDLNSGYPYSASPTIYTTRYDGVNHSIYINGELINTIAATLNTTSIYPFTLGKYFKSPPNIFFGEFEMVELIMYDRALNDEEMNNLNYYLNQKYKIN